MKYLFAFLLILLAASAWSASGDWYVATANYDEGDWTKTDSIYASDNRRAANAGGNTHRVGGKGFSVAVPTGYVPWKIVVRVEGFGASSTAARRVISVQLSKNGGATGVGDAVVCTLKVTTDSVITVNGSTNGLWGTTWTEAEIESANFTVNVQKNTTRTDVQSIDQISVQVWYRYNGTKAHFILGQGYNEAIDLQLNGSSPTTNYATGTSIGLGGGAINGYVNALFAWAGLRDSITTRTVDTAKLTVYFASGSWTSSPQFSFRILRRGDWDSATATWNIYKTASNWTTAGAQSTASDVYATVYGTTAGNLIGENTTYTFDVTTLFQALDGAVTDSTEFTLDQRSGDDEGSRTFVSANNTTMANRPLLEIWTTAGHAGGAQSARRRRMLGYKENVNAYSLSR